MEYRTLGRTGVKVSPLCLGAMNFGGPTGRDESVRMIETALDAGINFIDTANVYYAGESERVVGAALQEAGRRGDVVLATKVYFGMSEAPNDGGASYLHIVKACEDSLRRLQTDHIDLYQLHRPAPDIPQDETLRAFDDLIRAGKVRYIGCSTHPAWMVMEALSISERLGIARYVSEQPPYNLLDRRVENELIPLCQKYGLAVLPWSPLAMGILAGRYSLDGVIPQDSRVARMAKHQLGAYHKDRLTRKGLEVGAKVVELAAEREMTPGQLALVWLKDQPGVTSPIIGPRTMAHLKELLPVLEMNLDDGDRPVFDELVHPGNTVSDFHNFTGWMKARTRD